MIAAEQKDGAKKEEAAPARAAPGFCDVFGVNTN
jgi:hypothetical protein